MKNSGIEFFKLHNSKNSLITKISRDIIKSMEKSGLQQI